MKRIWVRILLAVLALALLIVAVGGVLFYRRAQQVADPNFDVAVARPAFTERHPKILFDEAHHNFHTAGGRYQPFVRLATNDGFQVTPNRQKFTAGTLAGYDLLVIANALGARWPFLPGAGGPAFTDEECVAVRRWVEAGGALLLIADHEPAGAAAATLAHEFGVEMSKGRAYDERNFARVPEWLLFSRENGLLADHAVTKGRHEAERVNRVVSFTGQSLKGPEGSVAFLRLADTAMDWIPPGREVSAAGRAQGVAVKFGRGRVVLLGEAAMLTAQLVGAEKLPFGMNYPGNDNRQLALNILHWLSGLLD